MRHNPQEARLVKLALDGLADALFELEPVLEELREAREFGSRLGTDTDPEWVCEQVAAAADALVSAIEEWIPSLVLTPRALDEVLQAITSWRPNEHTERAASSAQALFEQLKAESYGERTIDPDGVPDLAEFIGDLRATVETIEAALS